jgi:8-oxo-dGTP pyrophosphatase MutT (NUDIX family)
MIKVMTNVRTAARALIVKDQKLLLVKHSDHDGDWYMLPGGGQKKNDTLAQTLQRECQEETGYNVSMGPLVLVREYISNHHEFKDQKPDFHQIDLIFQCTLLNDNATTPTEMDIGQTGVEWVALPKLKHIRIYPSVLKDCFDEHDLLPRENIFLGDIN